MERKPHVELMLKTILTEFKAHVRLHCDYSLKVTKSIPDPTLENEILPMLSERWASGPGQHLAEIHPRLKPALQLASLFLTQDYPLRWFSHLTFGDRRLNTQGQRYLVNTAYSLSPEALSTVKSNLQELGKVITLMFEPSGYDLRAWGRTYFDRTSMKFFHEFRALDFPRALSNKGKAPRVCIVMNRQYFMKFYRYIYPKDASVSEKYRAAMMFTNTLVHEIAHAYYYWLHGPQDHYGEPLWSMVEKHAELGFSWESHVLGRVLNPYRYIGDANFRFRFLTSIQLEEYSTEDDRQRLIGQFRGNSTAKFTKRDVNGEHRQWPRVNVHEFRGAKWYLSEGATSFIAAIHAIPTRWIVNWFQQDVWTQWQTVWTKSQQYTPPPLDHAFMLFYSQDDNWNQVLRPLHTSFPVDAKILRDHAKNTASVQK
jgi:hypothetical protein